MINFTNRSNGSMSISTDITQSNSASSAKDIIFFLSITGFFGFIKFTIRGGVRAIGPGVAARRGVAGFLTGRGR